MNQRWLITDDPREMYRRDYEQRAQEARKRIELYSHALGEAEDDLEYCLANLRALEADGLLGEAQ